MNAGEIGECVLCLIETSVYFCFENHKRLCLDCHSRCDCRTRYCTECSQEGPYEHLPNCKQLEVPHKCPDCGAVMMVVYEYTQYREIYEFLDKPVTKKFSKKSKDTYTIHHKLKETVGEAESAWFRCPNYDDDEECCILEGNAMREGKPIEDQYA